MSLEKISVTLYDLFGYILPGFLILIGVSILEATFSNSQLLYLGHFVKNPVVATIMAYFLGQIAHATASWLKRFFHNRFTKETNWLRRWLKKHFHDCLTDCENRLSEPIYARVKEELHELYGIPTADKGGYKFNTLDTYTLSEAYLSVSGGYLDRDVYLAREGFAKSTMVALVFLTATLLACLLKGGAVIQTQPTPAPIIHLTWYGTILMAMACAVSTGVFRRQFMFFSRLKNNRAMLAFYAHRQKVVKGSTGDKP